MSQSNNNQHRYKFCFIDRGNRSECNRQDDVTIAEIGKEIVFDPTVLDTYEYNGWQPVHHDLMVVCAAVEFADRSYARPSTQWSRSFDISLPILELAVWQQPKVQTCLSETLRLLTGDDWHFSFIQADKSTLSGDRQRPLPFGGSKQFAIPYSDGLDSRCVSGIFDKGGIAVRVRLSKSKDKIRRGGYAFDLIPFGVNLKKSRESSVRSRGFKFAAITAIAGQISGVNRIIVPESGQGALGPVLLPLHNVYADYRNYPTFFRKIEGFIEAVLGYRVSYEQPRLWYTKGQTISKFLTESAKTSEYLLRTRSCWQRRRNVQVGGEQRQCGLCAACLLRRMSMYAARVNEPANAYTFADLTVPSFMAAIPPNAHVLPSEMVQYGSVGARHLQQFADLAGQPNEIFRRHVLELSKATGEQEENTRDNLRKLFEQHAEEWHGFLSAQGKHSFLNNWTKGGRYGRSE